MRPKAQLAATIAPAPAPRRPVRTQRHGVELVDDYAWFRADNWQDVLRDPALLPDDIRRILDDENAHAEAALTPFAWLRRQLAAEMRGRLKEDDAGVAAPDGPYSYYSRHREGGQQPIVCRRPREGGDEQVLIDGDHEAQGHDFFHVEEVLQSPDHRLIAWSADAKGSELHTIRVRDLATGQDLDSVPDTEGVPVWLADSSGFYYVRLDENHRPNRVFLHRLGDDASTDRLVFEEPDPGWFVHVRSTQSGRFAVISIRGHDASEAHLLDLAEPDASPRIVTPREEGLRYDVEHHDQRLVIRTNADGAEDFKIVEAPLANPARANWRDLVPHEHGRMIVNGLMFADFMVRMERAESLPRIVVTELATGDEHVIAFPEEAYALGFEEMFEFDTSTLRFSYSSMTTPAEIWDYDMRTRERALLKRQEIPSGHDPHDYVTRRVFALAEDGARVPVSLLHRRGVELDGSAPLLLYGYGSYGHSLPASFSANRLSLVDRGVVYAIAHIRGGTDKGWRWYVDGKLTKKKNTFGDFIAAARHLVAEGFTSEGAIVAHGGSAGGMLMGAVVNMAPDLFAGIVADVPFVDVLNTMLDGTLPLTPPEWHEWGNPILDRAAFDYIRSYSPYDNVAAKDYPPILALAGLTDPRVTYWEPMKWVARLRATMTGGGPVLLRTNMGAGHGGASGRFDRLDEVALIYAFALACMGKAQA